MAAIVSKALKSSHPFQSPNTFCTVLNQLGKKTLCPSTKFSVIKEQSTQKSSHRTGQSLNLLGSNKENSLALGIEYTTVFLTHINLNVQANWGGVTICITGLFLHLGVHRSLTDKLIMEKLRGITVNKNHFEMKLNLI